MKHFILRLSLFVLLLSIGAEVFFRVIIPAREAPIAVFQTEFGLETYDPSQQADGVFTSGRSNAALGTSTPKAGINEPISLPTLNGKSHSP